MFSFNIVNRLLNNKFETLNNLIKNLLTQKPETTQHKKVFREFIHKEEYPKLQFLKSIRKDHSFTIQLAK